MSEPPTLPPPEPFDRPGATSWQKRFRPLLIGATIVVWIVVFFAVTLPWIRKGNETSKRVTPEAAKDEDRPAFGEYVHVEEFPEPIKKWTPEYPERARVHGLEGTVVVQALVGKDGRVLETRIAKSDPNFDQAAEEAVRKYTFKPAKSEGEPVAVWVAVPIRFKLR